MLRIAVVGLVGCGAIHHPAASPPSGDEITLYRDRAIVAHRIEVDIPEAATATLKLVVAAGVATEDIMLVDGNGLRIADVHLVPAAGDDAADPRKPGTVELVLGGSHPGHYVAQIAYATEQLRWDAAYTMTTTAARDRATLRGAVAIRNTTGLVLHARAYLADVDLGMWRGQTAEHVAGTLVGTTVGATAAPAAIPRELGRVDLLAGDTRVEMLADDPPRKMASVLVYDPIGTKLDNQGGVPLRDLALGVNPPASTKIAESFEIERNQDTSKGLPGGPVRLLERQPTGALVVLGESRLFDASTRKADVDTIAIGSAEDVTGRRERKEITIDDDAKRLTEEFAITIANARPRPISVVLREHLYRSENWTLAYYSAPNASQEGSQQIAMRIEVPAKQTAKVVYVAVYSWCPEGTRCP